MSDLEIYLNNTREPWGALFYRMVWEQLSFAKGMRILDFGSGFGITADHLAENNDVTAVEPLREMTVMTAKAHSFLQIIGNVEALREFKDESFDLIVCHNVLEYAIEREEILREFSRLLKSGGILSVVKHHHPGRIMHKIVFENALDEVIGLLHGDEVQVRNFGTVHYYEPEDLTQWGSDLAVSKIMGVRAFWGLPRDNSIKYDHVWQDKMLQIELTVCEQPPYRDIAIFQHILLRKH